MRPVTWSAKACGPANIDALLADCNTAKAMRYYRLWIYTCNGALLLAVLVFCAVAGRTLVGDYRRKLVPGFALHQPSLVCAGAALLLQAGLLQAVGCAGALRLSERLLNAYWLMMLALLLGDAAIGVFWVFRLEQLCRELRPGVRARYARDYGSDPDFTALWERLQRDTKCCGVQWSPPPPQPQPQHQHQLPVHPNGPGNSSAPWPPSATCCGGQPGPHACPACEERLLAWVRHTADALFVLGYCVVAFLKLCFLGILRYEIREMIQKIRMLQTELGAASEPPPAPGGAAANGSLRLGEREALLAGRRDSDATSGCALLPDEAMELRELSERTARRASAAVATPAPAPAATRTADPPVATSI